MTKKTRNDKWEKCNDPDKVNFIENLTERRMRRNENEFLTERDGTTGYDLSEGS